MINFEFATATRILFGPGSLSQVGALAAQMGSRVLVVVGLPMQKAQSLLENLSQAGVKPTLFHLHHEPTIEDVQQGLQAVRQAGCDLTIGLGGGSAMDTAKAIAILLTNPGEIMDYLEVIGGGQAFTQPSLPCIAIPTTAGTGAEVTRNAVLNSPQHRLKVSLRSPLMLPRLALVDPELTYDLPPHITSSSGLDALTQLIEPYVSNRANPLTDALCWEGMQRAARSLRRAYEQGEDPSARQDMSIASLFSGLALANARLGAAHGFAAVLGGMFSAPHGALCARLLPFVVQSNVHALQQRQPENPALQRYLEIARLLTGDPDASIQEGIAWLQDLCQALQVPPLSSYGLTPEQFPQVVEQTSRASSTQGNPLPLTLHELTGILSQAI